MLAEELIKPLINYQLEGAPFSKRAVSTFSNDSRQLTRDGAYIAIVGERFDGHSALSQVIEAGVQLIIVEKISQEILDKAVKNQVSVVVVPSTYRAQAILAHQYYGQPSSNLNLTAVTGTNGKTTTSMMISDILEALGRKTGVIGTIQYKVADKTIPAVNTTPNAVVMHSLFADMVEAGCRDAVIEASSHALALGRLWFSDIDCAIFTNLSREHLDFHKTMEQYAYAKSLLFAQLGQNFHNGQPRLAIVNQDDAYASTMAGATGSALATYSLKDSSATAFAHSIKAGEGQLNFSLNFKNNSYSVTLPMLGNYNIMNYMAAFLCLTLYYGFTPESVLEATKTFKGVTGRMQTINLGQDFNVIVDFAHIPDALENILLELNKSKKGRLFIVFGHSGGNRDSAARPEIGDILFKLADEIVFTADNPRHEPLEKIWQELIGDHTEKNYHLIEDRETAIQHVISLAQAGDTICFAGKGGEAYQVIGDEYVPYNEVATVEKNLQAYLLNQQEG